MRLGERLHGLRIISGAALRHALQAQQVQGGRLGTVLVQQGALTVDVLAVELGKHLSVLVASEDDFQHANKALRLRLPSDVAAGCGALPLREQGGMVVVAMMDPLDARLVTLLETTLKASVLPCVAPELRIRYWLERQYSVHRSNVFLRAEAGKGREARRVIAAEPAPLPGEGKKLGRIATVKRAVQRPVEEDPFALDITVDARRRSPEAERALERITAATRSDDLAGAVCDYLLPSVDCGLLFTVRDQIAIGWRAAHDRDAMVLANLALPLNIPTAFRAVCESGAAYRGQPPEAARAWHERLASMLGRTMPRDLLIVPVLGEDRVLALIYTHMKDDASMPAQVVSDLDALAEGLSVRVATRSRD